MQGGYTYTEPAAPDYTYTEPAAPEPVGFTFYGQESEEEAGTAGLVGGHTYSAAAPGYGTYGYSGASHQDI